MPHTHGGKEYSHCASHTVPSTFHKFPSTQGCQTLLICRKCVICSKSYITHLLTNGAAPRDSVGPPDPDVACTWCSSIPHNRGASRQQNAHRCCNVVQFSANSGAACLYQHHSHYKQRASPREDQQRDVGGCAAARNTRKPADDYNSSFIFHFWTPLQLCTKPLQHPEGLINS